MRWCLMLALLLGASGCVESCEVVCEKVLQCGAMPGEFGETEPICVARCEAYHPRYRMGRKLCISESPCEDLQQGRCGSW